MSIIATAALIAITAGGHAGTDINSQVADMPHCQVEDASSGPVPCRWDGEVDGNGRGLSYYILKPAGRSHYLMPAGLPQCKPERVTNCHWGNEWSYEMGDATVFGHGDRVEIYR